MVEQRAPRDVLSSALQARTELVDAAVQIFDLAQFLLDDDERLTKSGALDGVGREQLQQRAIELLGGPPATDPDEDDVDADVDEDSDEDSDDPVGETSEAEDDEGEGDE